MDLTIYNIIKNVLVGGKCDLLRDKFGKFTFQVHKAANKPMIKNAVEKIWNVKVKKVHVLNVKGKNKAFGRKPFRTSDKKKAIVTLQPGYKIDLPGQFESMGAAKQGGTFSKEAGKGKEITEVKGK